jgi:hypothetical protein
MIIVKEKPSQQRYLIMYLHTQNTHIHRTG